MLSQKQIEANRLNAQKSTGPRTPAGKSRSSKNALKHGLLAQDAVLPGEDPADFDRQLTALENWACPRNPLEKEICRQIVDAQWRMQRLSRIETAIIASKMDHNRRWGRDFPSTGELSRDDNLRLLGHTMLGSVQTIAHLTRYDGHLTRRFHRAVDLLAKIRRDEQQQRQARENQKNRDEGYDYYDLTAPAGEQHRYIPAQSDFLNQIQTTRPATPSVTSRHQPSPVTQTQSPLGGTRPKQDNEPGRVAPTPKNGHPNPTGQTSASRTATTRPTAKKPTRAGDPMPTPPAHIKSPPRRA